MSDDDKKWIGDVLDAGRTVMDVLQMGRELARTLDPDPAEDKTIMTRLARIVSAVCNRLHHTDLAVDALTERLRRMELENGAQSARISVLEKMLAPPTSPGAPKVQP